MEMEFGYIESVRLIMSPPLPERPGRPRRRRRAPGKLLADAGWWRPLYKTIRPDAPRFTPRLSASSRKRKAIRHSLGRRVPAGWVAFLHASEP